MKDMVETGTELVTQEALTPAIVFAPGGVDPLLAEIASKARSHCADVSTAKGRKEIASIAHKVARSKTLLDGMGKDLVAEWKAKASAVDEERRKIRTFLDELKDEVRRPLTEYEDSEKTRVDNIRATIEQINDAAFAEGDSSALRDALNNARSIVIDEDIFAEFQAEAALAKERCINRLTDSLAAAEAREAEERRIAEEAAAAEAARREKEEADAKARAERAAAEEAERRRKWEAEAAERERVAAEKAKHEAERAAIEAQRKADEEKERARQAAELAEARRVANQEHRRTVNREAMTAIQATGVTEDQAKAIVLAIINGDVPHVTLAY